MAAVEAVTTCRAGYEATTAAVSFPPKTDLRFSGVVFKPQAIAGLNLQKG
jgi:hypothetical protein